MPLILFSRYLRRFLRHFATPFSFSPIFAMAPLIRRLRQLIFSFSLISPDYIIFASFSDYFLSPLFDIFFQLITD